MSFKPVSRLTKIFSSVILSGLALISSHAWANDAAGEQGPPEPQDSSLVEGLPKDYKPLDYKNTGDRADTRRIDEREDDLFARRTTAHVTRKNIWIAPAQRFDFTLLPLPETGNFKVTREFIELKPMKKEWYGQSTGIEYGIDAAIGPGSKSGLSSWDFRTGLNLGYYYGQDGQRGGEHNSRTTAFVEGARPITLAGNSAYMITGISFNNVAGKDIGYGKETRVYTELDFPALFGKAKSDNTAFGQFSATLKAYAGTQTRGAQLGIYFNDLKADGSGLNFSAGPEIRYESNGGVTYHFKFRVSPKFW